MPTKVGDCEDLQSWACAWRRFDVAHHASIGGTIEDLHSKLWKLPLLHSCYGHRGASLGALAPRTFTLVLEATCIRIGYRSLFAQFLRRPNNSWNTMRRETRLD